jgi:UDP:flavonoid glycosyltransferase YjiC (YdhE family)
VLLLPQGADLWGNAERVVAAGAGRSLLAEELSQAAVRDSVVALMTDPGYRLEADRIRAQIRSMPTPAEALRAIRALVD